MVYRTLNIHLIDSLREQYGEGEASQLAFLILEHLTGWDRTKLSLNLLEAADQVIEEKAKFILSELLQGKPVQYILHEAWFFGMKLYVDENVLIPRQETEELIYLIQKEYKAQSSPQRIIDLCTGSGCIAIALKKVFIHSEVTALDISPKAINVAKGNAKEERAELQFTEQDLLVQSFQLPGKYDLIVSNPPYVRQSEMKFMHDRVNAYEPHLALFVQDEDPLKFYNRILKIASTSLNVKGVVYFEINEAFGNELLKLAASYSFDAEILKDLKGKDRFLRAIRQ